MKKANIPGKCGSEKKKRENAANNAKVKIVVKELIVSVIITVKFVKLINKVSMRMFEI